MIRTILAVALLVAIGHEAAAAPRLKELVTVTGDLVRIGDLVENAGPAADVAVFRAPDLGQTGAVQVSRIADALRPYDVADFDNNGLSEVVVTRLSRAITPADIKERIARSVAGHYGFGHPQNLAVVLDRDVLLMHVEASATDELAVTRMNVDARTGRFDIAFELPGSAAARRLPLRFTGTVSETVETATATRAIRSGEVIKASDVVMERRPRSEVGNEVLSAEQATGLAARTAFRAGQVLRPGDLVKPQVVQRNEAIMLTYQVPGISLTARGKAMEAGAVGDIVGVLNIQSNRTVQAMITGPGRATVATATPIIAAAAAPAAEDTDIASSRTE